jgi:hypothetical protein
VAVRYARHLPPADHTQGAPAIAKPQLLAKPQQPDQRDMA